MAEWNDYTVADVISTVIDYRGKTPKKLGGDWSNHGYRALSAKNVKTGKIVNPDSIRYVSQELYNNWMKEEIEKEDILITSEAPFGQIYYWDSDEKIVLSQRLFAVRIRKEFYPKYIYFYMTSSAFQAELNSRATGTTVTGLRQPELLKCKILAPDYNEQKRIADILWSMEKKIDLNEEINNNLLEQAITLYRECFESDKSLTKGKISDIALNVTDGVHNTVIDDPNGDYFLLSCKNIKGGTLSIGSSERRINKSTFEKLRKRTKLSKGDILISSVGTIGEVFMLNTEPSHYEFQRSVAIVKPNFESVSSPYLYLSLLTKKAELINAAHGAVQQCLFISDIAEFPILIPKKEDMIEFTKLVVPMFDMITENENENMRLSSVRDALLPKLMSGEIDMSDIKF